jgi:hypothetical protein
VNYQHVDEGHGLASPTDEPPHSVVFEPLPAPAVADDDVAGAYSREAWFRVVGPAAWLVWGQIAQRLRGRTEVAWTLEELGDSSALPVEAVAWGLLQLTRHGLAEGAGEHRWRVQTVCPPLQAKRPHHPPASCDARRNPSPDPLGDRP